jgi:hypothetical protein
MPVLVELHPSDIASQVDGTDIPESNLGSNTSSQNEYGPNVETVSEQDKSAGNADNSRKRSVEL